MTQRRITVAFISCANYPDYPRMDLMMRSLGEAGFDVVAIMTPPKQLNWHRPGVRVVRLRPTGEFHPGMGLSAMLTNLAVRLSNGVRILYHLFRERPRVCVAHEPDSWGIAVLGKTVLHYHLVEEMNEVYEDRAGLLPSAISGATTSLVKGALSIFARATDYLIHVSERRRKYYAALPVRTVVIHHFPDLFPYECESVPPPQLPPERFVIVHDGPLRPASAPKELMNAILIAKETLPNLLLVILGGISGPTLSYQEEMNQLRATGHMFLPGRLDRLDVIRYLRAAQLGLCLFLPTCISTQLASPMKLFEYLAAGIPVLGSKSEGIEDVISRWKCGVSVDATAPKEIAESIVWLAQNEKARNLMSANSRKAAKESFNWSLEQPKLVGLFSELCGNASGYPTLFNARTLHE